MSHASAFDSHAAEYDRWFDRNEPLYRAEVSAMARFMPTGGDGLEIGVGTGRFALPLGISTGIDPSRPMLQLAQRRGIHVCQAVGEKLPFRTEQFDIVMLVTVVCFVADVAQLLSEAGRATKVGGRVLVGFIDKDSALGKSYAARQDSDVFYRDAHFHSVADIASIVRRVGLVELQFCQTLIGMPGNTTAAYPIYDGYGDGAFVVISATKKSS